MGVMNSVRTRLRRWSNALSNSQLLPDNDGKDVQVPAAAVGWLVESGKSANGFEGILLCTHEAA